MLKVIVFDCDGVMIDSREANRAYYDSLLEIFSCPLMTEKELDMAHMLNADDSTRYIFRNHPHIDIDEVDRYRRSVDYGQFMKYIQLEPDLPDFLRLIKPQYHTAISTNRTTMNHIMNSYDLRPWFELIVTASDVKNPKPAPDALFKILTHFNASAEEVIYIGDSKVDEEHGEAAGVDFIAFKNDKLKAKYHVNSFTEIAALPLFKL